MRKTEQYKSMISIIISSYKQSYFEQVSADVAATIGVPYEIIKIENPGLYSITQAYNMGGAKAQYDILCFMHEDIRFQTLNWGEKLISHFNEDAELGLVGIAGTLAKTSFPTGWMHHIPHYNKVHIVQHEPNGEKIPNSTRTGANLDFVKALDGVFLATRRAIWQEIRFSEKLTGFHVYDIDFSMRVGQHYKVAVTYDILIEHFSKGSFNDDWFTSTISYHNDEANLKLFDKAESAAENTEQRRFWYAFLRGGNSMSYKNRLSYVKRLGVDLRTLPQAAIFLYPEIITPLYNLYMRIRRIFNKNIEVDAFEKKLHEYKQREIKA